MNAFIRLLYSILVAAVTVAFVTGAVFTFYQHPKGPQFPTYSSNESSYTDYQHQVDAFKPTKEKYYRNVSIIVLLVAVLLVYTGFLLLGRLPVISEGLALGGLGTAVEAAITGGAANNRALIFIPLTVLFLSTLLIAYRQFGGLAKVKARS